jgi:hypothetical protein
MTDSRMPQLEKSLLVTENRYSAIPYMKVTNAQDSIRLVHFRYTEALLTPHLYVSYILIIQYFPSTYLFQQRTTVHLPKYHTHSCKTQKEWVLSHTEELHWARLYIYISVPQATKGIVSMKYSDALLINIPHIVLVITNQKCQEPSRYTGARLSIRLRAGLTQIINRTIGYKLQRSF